MVEEWRDIQGYEGYYQISNWGRIKSLSRITFRPPKGEIRTKEKIRKLSVGSDGYVRLRLHKNNIGHTINVHILVWDHFGDKGRTGFEIDHIDGNKQNNNIENLQLLTPRENTVKYHQSHGKRHGLPMGVYKEDKKYTAHICRSGKQSRLGTFLTPELASQAYEQARIGLP